MTFKCSTVFIFFIFISDLHSACAIEVCHFYNYMFIPVIIWPADILSSLHLILMHVMQTHNNSHKSVFLFEYCSVYILAFKATEVLYNVNRNQIGRTFDHWIEHGQSNFYATYQTSQSQRTGYFEYHGTKYFQYSITLIFKVQ